MSFAGTMRLPLGSRTQRLLAQKLENREEGLSGTPTSSTLSPISRWARDARAETGMGIYKTQGWETSSECLAEFPVALRDL